MSEKADDRLFSRERAIRGAKIGAIGSLAVVGGGALISGVSSAFISPGALFEAIQLVTEHPNETLQILGFHTAEWAVVGAIIDGFRPTSNFTSRFIERQVTTFKRSGDILRRGYRNLRNFDFSQARYNLTRPDESILRAKFFPKTAVIGGLAGAAAWGYSEISNLFDNAIGKSFGPTHFIAEHPLEVLAAGVIFGLAAGTIVIATDNS